MEHLKGGKLLPQLLEEGQADSCLLGKGEQEGREQLNGRNSGERIQDKHNSVLTLFLVKQ